MKTRKNKSREKAGKSLFNSESAGATVIAAVLLLSIIFTVLAVVRIEYIPQWKTDAEQSHMSEVQNDMAELKSTADMVSLFTASDKNSSANGFSVTVPFSMGGGEIPILEPSKSSGTLSVNTERCRMVITPKRSSITGLSKTVNCGGISYHSDNREYLDQVLRYENGALILAQGERSLMRQFPSFNIKQAREGNYTVSIQAIEIKGEPESISSNIDASLRLTGLNSSFIYDSKDAGAIDSFNCTIITKYPDAWISYLNETAANAELDYGTDYELEKRGSDSVLFSFHPTGSKTLERLYISKSVIQAELGAGDSLDYDSYGTGGGGSLPGGNGNVMHLTQWYNFNKVSDSNVKLNLLADYTSGADLSKTGTGVKLEGYSSSRYYHHNLNNPLDLTFGFKDFTEFKPNSPNSVTLVMIYQPKFTNPQNQNMNIAEKKLPVLTGTDHNTWYLYNQTVTGISVGNPSNLKFELEINTGHGNGHGNGNNEYINIDYLAIYLS